MLNSFITCPDAGTVNIMGSGLLEGIVGVGSTDGISVGVGDGVIISDGVGVMLELFVVLDGVDVMVGVSLFSGVSVLFVIPGVTEGAGVMGLLDDVTTVTTVIVMMARTVSASIPYIMPFVSFRLV